MAMPTYCVKPSMARSESDASFDLSHDRREVTELRRTNEILKAALAFSLRRPTHTGASECFHRYTRSLRDRADLPGTPSWSGELETGRPSNPEQPVLLGFIH